MPMSNSMSPLDHPCPKVSINDRPIARVSADSSFPMIRNILAAGALRTLLGLATLWVAPFELQGQQSCPPGAGLVLDSAWAAYRKEANDLAAKSFVRAQPACPENLDAKIVLGFALFRLNQVT